MKIRKLILMLSAASVGVIALPMSASAETIISFSMAPPAARYEVVPAARNGYLWSPGYWNAKGKRHVWQRGHWERQRVGYHFTQPTWTQRDNRWHLQRGRWNKGDRDGDGVPNILDRAPNNPGRS